MDLHSSSDLIPIKFQEWLIRQWIPSNHSEFREMRLELIFRAV
eukprot:SAG31_NODE_2448_length_5673_cov_3.113922_3_plen_43_part_00